MSKVRSHQELPTDRRKRELLRDKGQFWTPAWVAEAMVAYASEHAELIFDPATGKGAFFEALLKLDEPRKSYFGTDIDPEVLKDEIYTNANCLVEQRDFIKNPPDRKFQAIVGNPPYVRHHRIDEQTKLFLKHLTASITGFTIDGRAGYHVYFLLQALKHLDKDGRLAFILPADTCEGKFAEALWNWIAENYCIEAVITFDENATPFPNVDTNALVFLIKNCSPRSSFFWVKAHEAYTPDLLEFISSKFERRDFSTLEIFNRHVQEGLSTGFSRPEQKAKSSKYHLGNFATVMRGIATGCNEFFFLTAKQVREHRIPEEFLRRAIGRTKDVAGSTITANDIVLLEKRERPTYLLSVNGQEEFPEPLLRYLSCGVEMGLPDRSLIRQRKPWYKMEKRKIPPLLFAYLGRRKTRFIKNEAGVLPLTGFLCVYPKRKDDEYVHRLWHALNHPDTLDNLKLVGKSYGSGAIKVEPGNLGRLPIPEHIVEQYELEKLYAMTMGQPEIFHEPEEAYDRQHKIASGKTIQ